MSDRRSAARASLSCSVGALLGAGLLAAGAQHAHAFPRAQPQVEVLRGTVLVQDQPPGPKALRDGADERVAFEELNAALAAARAKLDQLTGAAEIAALATGLRTELERLRQENQELTAQLEEANSALGTARKKIENTAAEIAGKDQALERSRADAERLRTELAAAQRELAATTTDLTKAERERGEAEAAAEALRADLNELRDQLATAQGEVERVQAKNAKVEAELAELGDAADLAADAARQNLVAVEDKIRLLNEVLAEVVPAAENGARTDDAAPVPKEESTGTADASAPILLPAAAPAQGERQLADVDAAKESPPRKVSPDRPARPTEAARSTLARLTAELPLEARVQVENLLADVKATPHPRGLLMTVPGADVFEVDSETIGEGAHDTLAKVAELINIYDDRQVLVVGHTDAMGEPAYNQTLSERRARLVKQFLVEHFEIDPARLSTAGLGEERPIASNATRAGREANRRVEVLLMN